MNTKILSTIFFITALLLLSPLSSNAQGKQIFTLTADSLANGKTAELNEAGWKYHAGDDANWANPNFDDAGWETLKNSAMTKDSLPQTGWNGSGWFRLHLNVAPELADVPLNLEVGAFRRVGDLSRRQIDQTIRHDRRHGGNRTAIQSERRAVGDCVRRRGRTSARRALFKQSGGGCQFRLRQMD